MSANTKLLLHLDGADEAQTTTDSSASNHTVNFIGTAQLDTAWSAFGPSSLLLDGNSDCLSIPHSADWAFGAGDFTLEFRGRWAGFPAEGAWQALFHNYYDAANKSFASSITKTGGLYKFRFHMVGDVELNWYSDDLGALATNTPYHIAFVRDGNTFRFFLNGVAKGTGDCTTVGSLLDTDLPLIIGRHSNSATGYYFNGWMDEIRVSNVARWTSDFTPPTVAYGYDLGGSISAGSTASGALTVTAADVSMAGSISAVSTTAGSLSVSTPLAGSVSASSEVSAQLSSADQLLGSISVSSDITGSLQVATVLVGSVTAISSISGSLFVPAVFVGSVSAISTVTSRLTVKWNLYGNVIASGDAAGGLNVSTSLTGEATGSSNIAGSLGFTELRLIGTVDAVSLITGSLSVLTPLAGSITVFSSLSGVIYDKEVITLKGSANSESNISGNLDVLTGLVGSVVEVSGTADFLILNAIKFDGTVFAASTTIGNATCKWRLFGIIAAASTSAAYTVDLIPDFEATTLFWRPQANIRETLEWKTSVLKSHNGTEQRIKTRQSPRQFFKYNIIIDTNKLNTWWDSQLHRWLKLKWLIPVWTEFIEHTVDINHHDSTIIVDTTQADFRDGGKAIIWKSRTEYEVVIIDTVDNNQLNLNYTILNNFIGLKYIMPIREAYMTMSCEKARYNSEIAMVTLVLKIKDNTNLTGWEPVANYDGMPVLNSPAFMDATHSENSNPDHIVLDYETGTFEIVNHTDFNYTTQQHKFHNDTKAACWDFRKFLYSLSGKQKSVLIPTFRSDFTQVGNIVSGQTTVNIEMINLTENMGLNNMRKYIGFYFPSTGEIIVRKITGIATVGLQADATEEQITFDADLGYTSVLTPGDCNICFVDKCRLESDKVEINWERTDYNSCETKFARII